MTSYLRLTRWGVLTPTSMATLLSALQYKYRKRGQDD